MTNKTRNLTIFGSIGAIFIILFIVWGFGDTEESTLTPKQTKRGAEEFFYSPKQIRRETEQIKRETEELIRETEELIRETEEADSILED